MKLQPENLSPIKVCLEERAENGSRTGAEEIISCSEKYGPEEKYRACIEKKVDVMIDDRPEIVTYLAAKGIKVMMMDAPYNQQVVGDNIIRVFGWDDIYQKISDFGI